MRRLGLVLALFLWTPAAWAATAEPQSYVATIKKIEVSNDGGSSYLPVATQTRSFDIASTNASGEIIGDYARDVQLPDGDYNAVRVTLSNSITVSGRILQTAGVSTGTTFCTGGTTGVACTPTPITVTVTSALLTAAGITLPSGTTISTAAGEITVVNRSVPFTVRNGTAPHCQVRLNTSAALVIQSDNTLHPGVATVTLLRSD